MATKDKKVLSEVETSEEVITPEPHKTPEELKNAESAATKVAPTPSNEAAEEEAPSVSAADEAKRKQRRNLWLVFAACLILALVLPASFVYMRSVLPTSEPEDLVIVPIPENSDVSKEETKAAEPGKEKKSDDTLGAKYEDWDYHKYGRNIAEPRKGPRIYDSSGEVNPEYYDTYLKASGVDEPHVADLDISPRIKSGTNTEAPSFNQGDGTNTDTDNETSTATIRVLATDSEKNQASFLVDDVFAIVTSGGQIGGTGWFLKMVDGNDVQITNGDDVITLTVNQGTL